MNTELLKTLYRCYAPSGKTKRMRKLLKRLIAQRGGSCVQDAFGNLLVTKGEADSYPCLVAHYDQVSNHTHPKGFRVIESGGVLMGWSDKLLQQCGLGADDKNGLFICLNALERFDTLKVAFFVDEEIGCIGSSKVDLSFFSDVRFIVEPDRMNGSDLIATMCGSNVCSDDFIGDLDYKSYGYRQTDGSITDVLTHLERGLAVSCLNLSCGYYHPHTDQEVTVISELGNCQALVFHIIGNMTNVYPFVYEDRFQANVLADGKDDYDLYYEDYDTMERIMSEHPGITFDEIIVAYSDRFHYSDSKALLAIYADCQYYYQEYDGKETDFLRS